MYERAELVEGKQVDLPWRGKGGTVTIWKRVIVKEMLICRGDGNPV